MSSSPDHSSSNIHLKQSEQRLNEQLNQIPPVIKSLLNSANGTENVKEIPVAKQLLAAIPQLHSALNEIEMNGKIRDNLNKSIDQSLVQFDTIIETPLVQQLLNTLNANPDEIKKAVHMHNASIHQRLSAFEPIVKAVRDRSGQLINDILSHPDRLVTILFEHSPELVTDFLTRKGFGQEQLENFIKQIPSKSSISKGELLENLSHDHQMEKIENELQQSSNEKYTLNNCLKQLTSTPNLQAFALVIGQIGQSIMKK